MYIQEYLIPLFFPAQRPYWFVSVLPHNPIPFPYPYFPNPIPFLSKNIETEVEIRFFRRNGNRNKVFPSVSVHFHRYSEVRSRVWNNSFSFILLCRPCIHVWRQWIPSKYLPCTTRFWLKQQSILAPCFEVNGRNCHPIICSGRVRSWYDMG